MPPSLHLSSLPLKLLTVSASTTWSGGRTVQVSAASSCDLIDKMCVYIFYVGNSQEQVGNVGSRFLVLGSVLVEKSQSLVLFCRVFHLGLVLWRRLLDARKGIWSVIKSSSTSS